MLQRCEHLITDHRYQGNLYKTCLSGTDMVDWLMEYGHTHFHTRMQAAGAWQALLEESVIFNVTYEYAFHDGPLLYRWTEDERNEIIRRPTREQFLEAEQEWDSILSYLAQHGPDAMFRMILQTPPESRTQEDIELVYDELVHIKALSHLSTMVKRELARVLIFEKHEHSGTILFNQGDEGKSWYIILKGSVAVVIFGKGIVCTLQEGDDFGKLALVNDAPRAATIVLKEDNCHFLRVEKHDFNRILRDVEANTVRLKEHGKDVLVLEKIAVLPDQHDGRDRHRYSVMAGTPEKMLEYVLETRIDAHRDDSFRPDTFLEDFLLTHILFIPTNTLFNALMMYYRQGCSVTRLPSRNMLYTVGTQTEEQFLTVKRRVVRFLDCWISIARYAFFQDPVGISFIEELYCGVLEDARRITGLTAELAIMQDLKMQRDAAMKANTRRPIVVLDCGVLRQNDQDAFVRPFDTCFTRVFSPSATYTTIKVRIDQTAAQIKHLAALKLGYSHNVVNSLELYEVRSSGETVQFQDDVTSVVTMLSVNGRLAVALPHQSNLLKPLPEQEVHFEMSTVDNINFQHIAYHLAYMHWQLFLSTHEYEFLYQVVGRGKFGNTRICANLDVLVRRFNELQYWVPTEVLMCPSQTKRVQLIKKFIKMAEQSKDYHDLLSFFAITLGLSNIAVSRLSGTWERLPNKFRRKYMEFESLLNPCRNHRAYRLLVAKLTPPIIPFVPLLLKDLTFLHEGNKTHFDGLINFEKMHMISETLRLIRRCRSKSLMLEPPVPRLKIDVQTVVRNFRVIDNQRRLSQLSQQLEPKKLH